MNTHPTYRISQVIGASGEVDGPPPSATGCRGTPVIGWLYDWMHSSALGKPDVHYTSFVESEEVARSAVGAENVRAVCLAAPVAAPAQCPDCQGSGVDGDAGDDGRTIDVQCGRCNGTGNARDARLPWPWKTEQEVFRDAVTYLQHQPRLAEAMRIIAAKAAPAPAPASEAVEPWMEKEAKYEAQMRETHASMLPDVTDDTPLETGEGDAR